MILSCSAKVDPAQTTSDSTSDTIAYTSSVGQEYSDQTQSNEDQNNALMLARYDTLYSELNQRSGLLLHPSTLDSTLKFMIYGFDYYDAPIFRDGEKIGGIYLKSQGEELSAFGIRVFEMKYDSTWKRAQIPLIEEESDRPLFLLKGLAHGRAISGMFLADKFLNPGDSINIGLAENSYTFTVSGRVKNNIIYNYALVLITKRQESTPVYDTLIKALMMPLPNTSDIIPDFIYWAGDLNHDGLLDLISGDGMKTCSTYILWVGDKQKKFISKARFDGCGC